MNDEITTRQWIEDFISDYRPCEGAEAWLKASQFPDPQVAWNACQRGDWMAWLIDREMAFSDELLRTEEKRFAVKIRLARQLGERCLTQLGHEYLNLLERQGLAAASPYWDKALRNDDHLAYLLDYGNLTTVVSRISISLYNLKPPLEFFEAVADVIRQVYPEVPRLFGCSGE